MTEESSGHARLNDVPVASADELFGRSAANGKAAARSTRPTSEKPVRNVSSRRSMADEETREETPEVTPSNDAVESGGFRWQSQNLRSRGQQFLRDTVKQSAATASGLARENGLADFLPPAQAPDVPEPSTRQSSPLMIPGEFETAASGSSIVATPAGLKEDSFFASNEPTKATLATEQSRALEEVAASDASAGEVASVGSATPGLLNRISMRSWLLLIGGAVVVALLYLPGRKNAASATTAQI